MRKACLVARNYAESQLAHWRCSKRSSTGSFDNNNILCGILRLLVMTDRPISTSRAVEPAEQDEVKCQLGARYASTSNAPKSATGSAITYSTSLSCGFFPFDLPSVLAGGIAAWGENRSRATDPHALEVKVAQA